MRCQVRLLAFAALALVSSRALAKDVPVKTSAELQTAIAAAQPGDAIVLDDGTYDATGFSCTANGTEQLPITVRAKTPLAAKVRFDGLEGFKVTGAHWHFEDLDVVGVCASDSNCEHAFHVMGAAVGFWLRRSRVVDFNAQLKVNATQIQGTWRTPDKGLLEGNELYDTHARNTSNPTTKLNIDTGDDWVLRANYLHDFQKGGGDGVSYGAFLKSGGKRGLVERNLVVCTSKTPPHTGGTRIGLSFGGGGTAPQFCAPAYSASVPCDVEHEDGTMRNNVIVGCSDVGIYLNRAKNTRVAYNTLIGTAGIDFRFATTSGQALGNVLAGTIRNRDAANGIFANNLESVTPQTFAAWYVDPAGADLRQKGDLSALIDKGPADPTVKDDYCARTRGAAPLDLGALEHSLADCDTTRPPVGPMRLPGQDGGLNPSDDGGGPPNPLGDAGGNGASPTSSGCSCETVPSRGGAGTLGALAALGLLLARRRSRASLRSGDR